jgi:hypothetical protein
MTGSTLTFVTHPPELISMMFSDRLPLVYFTITLHGFIGLGNIESEGTNFALTVIVDKASASSFFLY